MSSAGHLYVYTSLHCSYLYKQCLQLECVCVSNNGSLNFLENQILVGRIDFGTNLYVLVWAQSSCQVCLVCLLTLPFQTVESLVWAVFNVQSSDRAVYPPSFLSLSLWWYQERSDLVIKCTEICSIITIADISQCNSRLKFGWCFAFL